MTDIREAREVLAEARFARTIAVAENWNDTTAEWVRASCYKYADADIAALSAAGITLCREEEPWTLGSDGVWSVGAGRVFVPLSDPQEGDK